METYEETIQQCIKEFEEKQDGSNGVITTNIRKYILSKGIEIAAYRREQYYRVENGR